jgi:hypothetical protein
MPTFKLTDTFGFSIDLTPGKDAALAKYFKSLPDIVVSGFNLAQLGSGDLSNPAVKSIKTGLSFSSPVNIGAKVVDLKIGAGLNGSLTILVPDKEGGPLFSPDVFGDEIPVKLSQRFVSMGITADVSVDMSGKSGDLTFGFSGKSAVALSYYRRFDIDVDKTPVLDAIQSVITQFPIPGDLDDIASMPAGSVATVESTGSLKFSGSANLLSITNPLASATLPIAGDVKLNAGASIKIAASYQFSGDYQVRVSKVTDRIFRLGFYKKRQSDFTITASADEKISATIEDSELISK